jgi:hypothetical protein
VGLKSTIMGANWFRNTSTGKSVKEAYNRAVDIAEEEYGHQQGYSGEINCSSGYRDVTAEFKASKMSLQEFIDKKQDTLTKHQGAQAICIIEPKLNTNKNKSQVLNTATKGTTKWVLKYTVRTFGDIISRHNTKGDAIKAARAYTEKHVNQSEVIMEKLMEKGSDVVARVSYKRSSDERDGKWVFFGWASY